VFFLQDVLFDPGLNQSINQPINQSVSE